MQKKKAVLFTEQKQHLAVYTDEQKKELNELFDLSVETDKAALLAREDIGELRYIFTTWGMPHFTEEEVSRFSSLEAVFYGAGSVQHFAREFISAGVKVFSAWAANAVPVAEYAVSQIILANKGFFQSSQLAKSGRRADAQAVFHTFRGNYGQKVGLLGAGMIGRLVIGMLKAYRLDVMVFDPFLPDEAAEQLGVTKGSLEEVFSSCNVVSNHLANNPQTVGMLEYACFSKLPKNGVFINTGRGATVVEDDLVRALREEPGRFALLDVTWPEPPTDGHPFYTLPNILLTPHIAGSSGDEVHRMTEYMLEEYHLLAESKPTRYEVSMKMLETMA